MKESTPPVLKVSLPEAEELLQAEALEAHPPMGWSAAESDAASRDALAVAGKSDIQAFLLTRAKLVLSRMTKHDPSLKRPRLPQTGWLIKSISLGIIFLGFFSGAVTDQLTSAGAQLNLLSPPLLTVFAWNILAMLAAIAGLVISFRRSTSPAGLSAALARILGSAAHVMRFVAIGKPTDKTYFNKLLPLLLPQTAWRFRAVLHWAALAFGIGLAASLLVRGIGTAYWAVWESTWFADKPDVVAAILQGLYGWLPDFLPGLSPLPDASALSALRVDGSAPSAAVLSAGAPWLARMIWSIVGLIIVPRAVLAAISMFCAARAAQTLIVPIDSSRTEQLLQTAANHSVKTWLLNGSNHPAANQGTPLLSVNPWSAPDFPELAAFTPQAGYRTVLELDPSATPEEDVHGLLIDAIRKRCANTVLHLDFSELQTRFADVPERIQSRRALWEHFAAQHDIPLEVNGLR